MSFPIEAQLVLILAAVIIAGLARALARAHRSLEEVAGDLEEADRIRTTADGERGLAELQIRRLRDELARAVVDREEWRSEVRKAREEMNTARSALMQSLSERDVLLQRLEPAQQIMRQALAIRARIAAEKAAHEQDLTTRRMAVERAILRIRTEANALRTAHLAALQRYEALRGELAALEEHVLARRTAADAPEARPVTPQSDAKNPVFGPGIRAKGSAWPPS